MTPIRIGFVGLSAAPSGSGWGKTTHLPYLKASKNYDITGVLNSSLKSSQAAIDAFELSGAKPFADIDTMAADPNIDLVVVCVKVSSHAEVVRGALKHKKQVFCEWPLAKDAEEASKLAALAKEAGVRCAVDLESRLSPVSSKLRELISSGTIGKILSTDVTGTLGPLPAVWSEEAIFYLDAHSGQNPLHTRVGHFLDAFLYVVGEFAEFEPRLVTHAKEVKVYNAPLPKLAEAMKDPSTVSRTVQRTAPDEVLLQGLLGSGAAASFHIRSGSTDADGNVLRWLITGTEGLIEVTQKTGQFIRDKSVEVKVVKDGKAEIVQLDWETQGEYNMFGDTVVLATPGRNYKALAENMQDAIIDFDHAEKRHRVLDDIVRRGIRG